MFQSIPTGYIPPGNLRDSLKKLPRGSGFDSWKLPRGREFDKGRDFVESPNYAKRHLIVCSAGSVPRC